MVIDKIPRCNKDRKRKCQAVLPRSEKRRNRENARGRESDRYQYAILNVRGDGGRGNGHEESVVIA